METHTYLILLNFAITMCMLPSTSTLIYSSKSSRCNLILKSDEKLNPDFFNLNSTECNYIDYWISVEVSHIIVMKLRLELERVHKIMTNDILFEIFDNSQQFVPIDVIYKNNFNDPGENVRVLKFVSSHNKMILRVHKVKSLTRIPFLVTYHPKGICLPDQLQCLGEDDCYYKMNRCDGVWDCLENGSDELNCTGCINSYKCQNKSTNEALCFRFSEKCNGRPMCMNGDDQRNCDENQCNIKRDAFLCKNRRCIRSNWVCDGIDDCHDFSDEAFCPSQGNSQVTVIAVTGSVSCVILSFIIIWFSCKLYLLRRKRSREREAAIRGDEAMNGPMTEDERDWWDFFFRDCRPSGQSRLMCHHGQHISPIMEVQNEIFARLSAPPPYQIAMATSRSFDEVVAEEMAQRLLEVSNMIDDHSDEELLNPSNSQPPRNGTESDDDSLMILEDTSASCRGRSEINGASSARSLTKDKKASVLPNQNDQRSSEELERRFSNNIIYGDEPPTFEEATGEGSEIIYSRSLTQVSSSSDRNSIHSDNNSERVPPSYSSLFPSTQDGQTSFASLENVDQDNNHMPPSRFKFLTSPLQSLKSIFSNWGRSPHSSSLTELISNQDELGRTFNFNLEHEIQRIIMTRRPIQDDENTETGNQTRNWTNQEDIANLQWEVDWSCNANSQQSDFLTGSMGISSEAYLLPRGVTEEQPRNSWTFRSDGVYQGDYNAGISSDSENDEKDG